MDQEDSRKETVPAGEVDRPSFWCGSGRRIPRCRQEERAQLAAKDNEVGSGAECTGYQVAYAEEVRPGGSSCDDIHSRAHCQIPFSLRAPAGSVHHLSDDVGYGQLSPGP